MESYYQFYGIVLSILWNRTINSMESYCGTQKKLNIFENQTSRIMSSFNEILGELTEAEVLRILPNGLKTPAAMIARHAAYAGVGGSKQQFLSAITTNRDKADWKPNQGHKRAVLLQHIAVIVAINAEKNFRPKTAKMREMITKSFSKADLMNYVKLYMRPWDTSINWQKDGVSKTITVPKVVAEDADLLEWVKVRWPVAGNP
jgi:hypothetical protein